MAVSTASLACMADFHPTLRSWFLEVFSAPTAAQVQAWPVIGQGKNMLLLAPTGSGKTLAAFLVAIDRIMFGELAVPSSSPRGVRTLYISPLKALGVDVERNLRSPIAGVRMAAERAAVEHHVPVIGVRSGDTPPAQRHQLNRRPPDILITTPESLYLLLTSRARDILRTVDTVIVDEIHSLVATKRGAHLFVSLERLEGLRGEAGTDVAPLQRIGLSATQRPLAEIARLLGGAEASAHPDSVPRPRPVEIVEAGRRKQLDLRVELPVEDMAHLASSASCSGTAEAGSSPPSIWPAIHPRLVELIRQHRSTMVFVNSRRLAERLAAAINDVADQEIAMAHHGSIAKEQRLEIEDRLKRGLLPAIVATSSLELGIDMGAVDLVIQIEAPPSIAAGMQRIGRSGHRVGASSAGVIFPKYRGDLLACSAATACMMRGDVEETFYPRNPLDVLAQQIVAMAALGPVSVDQLFATMRAAAPFHELPRSALENVLDLLAGRYPSDEFSELRPRLNWDRLTCEVSPRRGTQRLAVVNGGTIPDRGLYGVFLAEGNRSGSRVGELDEEMVFETRPGDVFLLGASSWRVLDITHDRVLVAPAPGEPGRMPFWRGDGPGRPLDFGRAMGTLTRRLLRLSRAEATDELTSEHALDPRAAANLLDYLHDQAEVTGEPPSDRTILIESFLDEVGDWRVAILSPFGARIHAPWAMAVMGRLRQNGADEVDMIWTDDGIMLRLTSADQPPSEKTLVPHPDEIEQLVTRELGSTALFAARFRENAARALLLPRRFPGKRSPLWVQRRRAADLLSVASRFPGFPLLLETYRECLRDVFDIKGLTRILEDIQRQVIRVRTVETKTPSPFASSLMFTYTANFIYDGDAPLAERRARALALDHAQLRELLGDVQLCDLLCGDVIDAVALQLQRLDGQLRVTDADGLHDLLRQIGDLSRAELYERCGTKVAERGDLDSWIEALLAQRRIIAVRIAGALRYGAVEDAARFRDVLGSILPPGLPDAFLESAADPLVDLVSRYARTHRPFLADEVAARFGLGVATIRNALAELARRDRVVEGEFVSGRGGRQWCDVEVLRTLKRKSLAQLRQQIEPVEPIDWARFLLGWQGVDNPRRGLDGLLDTIEQLQGLPLPASVLEREILPARVAGFTAADLDELCAAGEVVWRGCEQLGAGDGRVALYLTDHLVRLTGPVDPARGDLPARIRELLSQRGALFFDDMAQAIGGFRNDLLNALWELVWAGEVTNDTLAPLRALRRLRGRNTSLPRHGRRAFRSRRSAKMPGSEGRWSPLVAAGTELPTATERQTALAAQLVARYGVLTREAVVSEGVVGGFSSLYPILKAMEEAGRVRRGYFVAGLGAAQFAAPGAEDRLREAGSGPGQATAEASEDVEDIRVLAATDPANPYGAGLPWPAGASDRTQPQRSAGARVVLRRGELVGYLGRTGQHLLTFPAGAEPDATRVYAALVKGLRTIAQGGQVMYITRVDGGDPANSELSAALIEAGFTRTARGYLLRAHDRSLSDERRGRE